MSQPAVHIADVWARDGLQTVLHESHLKTPSTAEKIEVIEALDDAGVPEIEITGFAHPAVIPSLADAEKVAEHVLASPHKAVFRALVPNYRGAQRALAVGVPKLRCLLVASETYQRLNSNMSVEDNLIAIEQIVELATSSNTMVAANVGTAFICPYEGLMPESRVLDIISRYVAMGIRDVTLSDSVGLAWPSLVRQRCLTVMERWPDLDLGLHLHTLGGLALANCFAAFEVGVRRFEGSVGGIGGGIAMPVHTTSMGNVATEDLVYLFESCDAATGIDAAAIGHLGRRVQGLMGTGSSYASAFLTIDDFLAQNRTKVEELTEAPPGSVARLRRTDDSRRVPGEDIDDA